MVVAAVAGLALAGRVVDLPEAGPPPSTATTGLVSIATVPPAAVPEALRGRCGCPSSAATAPARPAPWPARR